MTDFKLDHRSSTSDDRGKKESQNHRSSRYSENNTLALTLTGPAFYGDQPHMEQKQILDSGQMSNLRNDQLEEPWCLV